MDITNQKLGVVGSAADGIRALSAITVGTIPAIKRFIDSSSDTNVLVSARRYEPPAMSRMNSAWKIVQPKAKPRMYSSATSAKPEIPKALDSTAPASIPMPSPATQCIVDPSAASAQRRSARAAQAAAHGSRARRGTHPRRRCRP